MNLGKMFGRAVAAKGVIYEPGKDDSLISNVMVSFRTSHSFHVASGSVAFISIF